MSVGQQQYTILAPASTSSVYASPPRDTLPPSLSKKKTRKQASSKSSHMQRSPQPPGMTAAVAQTAVDRLISAQLIRDVMVASRSVVEDEQRSVAMHPPGEEGVTKLEDDTGAKEATEVAQAEEAAEQAEAAAGK